MAHNTRQRGNVELTSVAVTLLGEALTDYAHTCNCVTTVTTLQQLKERLWATHNTNNNRTVFHYESNQERQLLIQTAKHALETTQNDQKKALSNTIIGRIENLNTQPPTKETKQKQKLVV